MRDPAPPRADLPGYAALFTAVIIWGGWMPATRLAANDGVAPLDVALLRYGVPALVLLPIVIRLWPKLRAAPVWSLIGMMGWGAPFVFCVSLAMGDASVAHTAALVPCMMPLLALAVERALFGTRVAAWQVPGFVLIGICAALVLGRVLLTETGTRPGSVALLLLASAGWGMFTLSFRRSGLAPLEAAAFVCAASTLLVLPPLALVGSTLGGVSWQMLGFHALAQGVFSGIIATAAYAYAIGQLGVSRSAASGVLVPALATGMALIWLNEVPAALDVAALALGTLGVAIVNGLFRRRQKEPLPPQ